MSVDQNSSGLPAGDIGPSPLSPQEFSSRLEPLRRPLWLIAAAILGAGDDADDVVQEAAMIGLRKLGDFEPSTSFAAWMGQIVRNVARNQARKHRRRRTQAADPGQLDRTGTSANGSSLTDALAHDPEFDLHVQNALAELDEVARMCLLLRTVRQMPYREISSLLQIPEGTAMSHVHRARQTLRARLAAAAGIPEEGRTR